MLLNHAWQPANALYRASHAIFIRAGAVETYDRVGEIPEVMRDRLLSLCAYEAGRGTIQRARRLAHAQGQLDQE